MEKTETTVSEEKPSTTGMRTLKLLYTYWYPTPVTTSPPFKNAICEPIVDTLKRISTSNTPPCQKMEQSEKWKFLKSCNTDRQMVLRGFIGMAELSFHMFSILQSAMHFRVIFRFLLFRCCLIWMIITHLLRIALAMVGLNSVQAIIDAPFSDSYEAPHQLGPDYIIPTKIPHVWNVKDPVKLNLQIGDSKFPPQSVVTYLENGVKKYPNNCAMLTIRNNTKIQWSYTEYLTDVRTAAKGFIKLGLKRFAAVAIVGFNAPEWFISHFGAIFAGGLPTGIYSTNSADACFHILSDSAANIAVVENETQLEKILSIRSMLPNLKTIIQYSGKPTQYDILSWENLMLIGKSVPDEILDRRIRSLAINQCCAVIYTSATTGKAKGVMLNHDNIIYTIRFFVKYVVVLPKGCQLSYLPLSHVAAMGKLGDYLLKARPVAFFGVPRIFEKISEKIREIEQEMRPLQRKIFQWARQNAMNYNKKKIASTNGAISAPFSYKFSRQIVLKKVKKRLGWDKTAFFFAGGAPFSPDVLNFFLSLDILITDCFGMSETTGPFVSNTIKNIRIGSVGKLTLGEIKFANTDEKGNGEMIVRGRNVFMGYLNLEEQTIKSFQSDGWFATGDIASQDKDGYITITGRCKELIITSGGENIAPVPIENTIKLLLPVVNNCMLIGEKRKYLTILLTLKTEVNMETYVPTNQLTITARHWCHEVGSQAQTVTEILDLPETKVLSAIQAKINEYNTDYAVSNAQRIQKWIVLPCDFSLPGGEFGPSMKLKRQFVLEKYKDVIDKLYAS
uniref:long-chain-fatty-acid--CoA ligase n=1 Tax=Strigamia maritima TaxID=126957 RepID=T1IGS3_STRMM